MNKNHFLLLVILILAFTLRFYNLLNAPPGINRDEAAIGYNAYSIYKTGKDEYGIHMPLSLKSFGDWKLPLYIYTTIIPVAINGLNEVSVRIPSVFAGTMAVYFTYLFCMGAFKELHKRRKIALTASLFFAVSPWSIHFSRVASEANVSMMFVLLGVTILIRNLNSWIFIIISSLIVTFGLFTYHGSHVFIPLLTIGIILYLYFNQRSRKGIIYYLIPFFVISVFIYSITLFTADKTKISGLTPLSDQYSLHAMIDLMRSDHMKEVDIGKLFHNKLQYIFERFSQGYINGFSPDFLFIRGGTNKQHNIPDFGNLYIFTVPLIISGIYFLVSNKSKAGWLLLFWLIVSPIPAALTKDAPHSARMYSVNPVFDILTAVALILILYKMNESRLLKIFFCIVFSFYFGVFLDRYMIHFARSGENYWGQGYSKLFYRIDNIKIRYKQVLIDRPDHSPYIYYLFYKKFDPETYQKTVVRYPDTNEGFSHVKQLGNLEFKKIDWSDDLIIPDRILVSWVDSTPVGATDSAHLIDQFTLDNLQKKYGETFGLVLGDKVTNKIIDTITLENGEKQFYLIEVKNLNIY